MDEQNTDTIIPEKFINSETGETNIEALVKSYKELEKKLSLGDGSDMPENPKQYDVNMDHNLFDYDDDLNEKMFELGFTNRQVQLVYDMAAEKLVPMVSELAGEFEAEKQMGRLNEKFGGADKYKEIARQLKTFGEKNLAPEILEALSTSYEGIMALYQMMQSSEPKAIKEKTPSLQAGDEELKNMVRDPKYWRDKDPAFVAKVTQAFQDFYKS